MQFVRRSSSPEKLIGANADELMRCKKKFVALHPAESFAVRVHSPGASGVRVATNFLLRCTRPNRQWDVSHRQRRWWHRRAKFLKHDNAEAGASVPCPFASSGWWIDAKKNPSRSSAELARMCRVPATQSAPQHWGSNRTISATNANILLGGANTNAHRRKKWTQKLQKLLRRFPTAEDVRGRLPRAVYRQHAAKIFCACRGVG